MKSILFYLFLTVLVSVAALFGCKTKLENDLRADTLLSSRVGDGDLEWFHSSQERTDAGVSEKEELAAPIFYRGDVTDAGNSVEDKGDAESKGATNAKDPKTRSVDATAADAGSDRATPRVATANGDNRASAQPPQISQPPQPPQPLGTHLGYSRKGNEVVLHGTLQSADQRNAIRSAILDPSNGRVSIDDDQLEVDASKPSEGWIKDIPAILRGDLGKFKDLDLSIARKKIAASGTLSQGIDKAEFEKGLGDWANRQGLVFTSNLKSARPGGAASPVAAPVDGNAAPAGGNEARAAAGSVATLSETFTIVRQGNRITLDGSVASEQRREALGEAAAKVAGVQVSNQLKLLSDAQAPAWSKTLPAFLPRYLTDVPNGNLSLGNDGLVMAGKTKPGVSSAEIATYAKSTLGEGAVYKTELSEATDPAKARKPARFILSFAQNENAQLEGEVPAGALRENLARIVSKNTDQRITVENRIKSSPEIEKAPWILPAAEFLPVLLQQAEHGRLEVGPSGTSLKAVYAEPANRVALERAFQKDLAEGPKPIEIELKQIPQEEVREEVVSSLGELAIYFGSNSVDISPEERIKIGKAAEAIKRLDGKGRLVVGGHADSKGNADYNRRLSIRRAGAVRDVLVGFGVAEDLMTLQSFGESKASKTAGPTDDRLSRRVEIRLVPKP